VNAEGGTVEQAGTAPPPAAPAAQPRGGVIGLFVDRPVLTLMCVLATVLIGVSAASDAVGPGAVMGDVVVGKGGTVVAVFQMAGDLGLVLGPVVTGLVADAAGYTPAFVLCAVVCVLPVFAALDSPR